MAIDIGDFPPLSNAPITIFVYKKGPKLVALTNGAMSLTCILPRVLLRLFLEDVPELPSFLSKRSFFSDIQFSVMKTDPLQGWAFPGPGGRVFGSSAVRRKMDDFGCR